jgi:hypothetical protein
MAKMSVCTGYAKKKAHPFGNACNLYSLGSVDISRFAGLPWALTGSSGAGAMANTQLENPKSHDRPLLLRSCVGQ